MTSISREEPITPLERIADVARWLERNRPNEECLQLLAADLHEQVEAISPDVSQSEGMVERLREILGTPSVTLSARSIAKHERDHKGEDYLAKIIEFLCDTIDEARRALSNTPEKGESDG